MPQRGDPLPGFHLPQLDLAIVQSGSQGAVEGERHRMDRTLTRQQRQGTGRGRLVQPHADAAGHGQTAAVGRKGYRPVAFSQGALSQTHRRRRGQMPGPVVPLQLRHGGAHAFRCKRRQLAATDGHAHGVRARMEAQGKGQLRPAVGIRSGVLDREPAAELPFADGDREGDGRIGQEIAVLIAHFHHQGLGQPRSGGALLAVARDDLQRKRTGPRPLRHIPQQDLAIPPPAGERGATGRQGHGEDLFRMPEGGDLLPGQKVPQDGRAIP